MSKSTAEQILGSYPCVIGFNENVAQVLKILESSGRLRQGSVITETVAMLVWSVISSRNSLFFEKVTVTEAHLDSAMLSLKQYVDDYC